MNKSGKYIYYIDTREHNIVKIKDNGKGKEVIVEDVDNAAMTVVDNWIYYFDNSCLYRIKTNGENKKIISKKSIDSYQIEGNWIYYSYINDGKYVIAKMKADGEDITKIDLQAGKTFLVKGNNIYYICENNDTGNYELYKMKTNGKNKKKIADITGSINEDIINFTEDAVYYAKRDENLNIAIYKMNLNGKSETKVVDIKGYITNINVHDNWIYYPDENDDGDVQMFRIKVNGENKEEL